MKKKKNGITINNRSAFNWCNLIIVLVSALPLHFYEVVPLTLQVAALHNTPEYRLGIRRNAQMNPGKKTITLFLCSLIKPIFQFTFDILSHTHFFAICPAFFLLFYLSFSFVSTQIINHNLWSLLGRNYTQLEDIREDLLSGVVKGALVDSYVAAERKDLFDDPDLYIHQVGNSPLPPLIRLVLIRWEFLDSFWSTQFFDFLCNMGKFREIFCLPTG